jgi:hypothetical protein
MVETKRFLVVLLAMLTALILSAPFTAYAGPVSFAPPFKTIASGETWVVPETTKLAYLKVEPNAVVAAPAGRSLTMTVNGVETGQKLSTTAGVETVIKPGTYRGNIVLTVAEANVVAYDPGGPPGHPTYDFPFRQALYLDSTGIVTGKSVLSAMAGQKPRAFDIRNILIRSTGEAFDGIFVAGSTAGEPWKVTNAKIELFGNGRSDFTGYGAAVVGRGADTTLVVDGARIVNKGVARAGIVADQGANVVVKNSFIQTYNGTMPADYMPTIDTSQMRSVPWMLGLSGNVRATNLLGTDTKASYINSYIGSEGWGVLSTDGCTTPTLTAINSTIAITGEDGYGSYGIGDATEYFLGCTFDVATYSTISRGSRLFYGDSDQATVAQLNTDLGLGLTPRELRFIPRKPTIVNSKRFGVMWHGGGTLDISGGTVFNTAETTFLNKGQAIEIAVDGSEGARLNPENGVILQVMDDDDPGPVPPDMYNIGVYDEPTGPVVVQAGHDIYTAGSIDAMATFSNIRLRGDFYNSMRGDIGGMFGPPSPRNMGLTFIGSRITGVISSSTALHLLPHIEYPIGWSGTAPYVNTGHTEDYKMLGVVTNTPAPAVNNGVIVSLNNSRWVVTGTSCLTKLAVAGDSTVTAPPGKTVSMTVDGAVTTIDPGSTYTGAIVLTVD